VALTAPTPPLNINIWPREEAARGQNSDAVDSGPLFIRTLDGRADALSVLADVASQREGESDVPDSHFLTLLLKYTTGGRQSRT